jgi:hypothetical protein
MIVGGRGRREAFDRGGVVRCRAMKSSSARRVLKSVVGPALGATLGAMVAAGGCAKEEAKPTPTSTETPPPQPEVNKPPSALDPPKEPEPATAVEPEKPAAGGPPAADAAPPDAGKADKPADKKKPPAKADKKDAAKKDPAVEPKKDPPAEPKKSPSTEWYAGTMLERDIRPMRPARRGTDTTIHALMTGLHDPALRPLA